MQYVQMYACVCVHAYLYIHVFIIQTEDNYFKLN